MEENQIYNGRVITIITKDDKYCINSISGSIYDIQFNMLENLSIYPNKNMLIICEKLFHTYNNFLVGKYYSKDEYISNMTDAINREYNIIYLKDDGSIITTFNETSYPIIQLKNIKNIKDYDYNNIQCIEKDKLSDYI